MLKQRRLGGDATRVGALNEVDDHLGYSTDSPQVDERLKAKK